MLWFGRLSGLPGIVRTANNTKPKRRLLLLATNCARITQSLERQRHVQVSEVQALYGMS